MNSADFPILSGIFKLVIWALTVCCALGKKKKKEFAVILLGVT